MQGYFNERQEENGENVIVINNNPDEEISDDSVGDEVKKMDKGSKRILIVIIVLGVLLLGLIGLLLYQHFSGSHSNSGFGGGGGGESVAASDSEDTPGDSEAQEEQTPAAPSEASENSSISGRVFDASSKAPVKDAQISAVSGGNSEIGNTDTSGIYHFDLDEGLYRITITCSGYHACVINNVHVQEGEAEVLENLFLLPEGTGGLENKTGGTVTNMVTGASEPDVKVRFLEDWNSMTGEYITGNDNMDIVLTTDAQGKYQTTELPYGYYTAEISKEGFVTQYVNVISSGNQELSMDQVVLLPPIAENNDYRVTLSWGVEPRDLDAHLTGNTPEAFEVYFGNRNAVFNGETVATLDHNDKNGNGFETVTLKADPSGTYHYYVAKYKSNDGSFVNSNAIVKIYKGGELIEQFNAPVSQEDARYWNVFSIENGQLKPINQLSDTVAQ